SVVAAYMV
nr:RecName: Full=Unknown protein from spot 105 of 2D-PAGE of thylakoid [Pisum sativum]